MFIGVNKGFTEYIDVTKLNIKEFSFRLITNIVQRQRKHRKLDLDLVSYVFGVHQSPIILELYTD